MCSRQRRRKRLPVDEYRTANSPTLTFKLHGQLSDRSIASSFTPPCSTVSSRRESPMQFAPVRRPQIVAASFALIVAVAPVVRAQQSAAPPKVRRDRCNRPISRPGRAFASRCCRTTESGSPTSLRPNEGDASVIIRSTGADAKETQVPDRRSGGAGGGRGGAAGWCRGRVR